jgi:hypothetical protein
MLDPRRKRLPVMLFLAFTVAWFGSFFAANVVQAQQHHRGMGDGDTRILSPSQAKNFFKSGAVPISQR